MIKEIGTIGFYIKFNESASAALKFLEVFSSSAADVSLFSASTNSSNVISKSLASASFYLNGSTASTIYSNEWCHSTFVFNPKLQTDSDNNFLVRFGNTSKADFNIQNVYITDMSLSSNEIQYLHSEFTGGDSVIFSGDLSSTSLSILDKNETNHSSSVTGSMYQPLSTQNKFIYDVKVAIDTSASQFVSTVMTGDSLYFDTVPVIENDIILSLADNQLYKVTSSATLETVSSSSGDYVYVLSGLEYGNKNFINTSGSFTKTGISKKFVYNLVIDQ